MELVFAATATPTSPGSSAARSRTAAIIRARLRGLAPGANVRIDRQDRISVFLPGISPGAPLTQQVAGRGVLTFYDWEASVLGPAGRPAPTDETVTGGSNAGSARSGITLYAAVIRASKRAIKCRNDATLGSAYKGVWYLLDRRAHKVLGGPALSAATLSSGHRAAPTSTPVHVQPGNVIVGGERPSGKHGSTRDGYYVLDDAPALGNRDITDPQEAVNPPPGSGQPSVTFNFTSDGRRAFRALTKVIARRGATRSAGGKTDFQHFAIVLDDRVISVPSIDFHQYPDGVDAGTGGEIVGGFTVTSARLLAQILQTGVLPVSLTLFSERPSSA